MNALTKVEDFKPSTGCSELAYFWRGACLELFSQAELAVADCIEALRSAGMQLPKECAHPFPATRLSGLRDLLSRDPFDGHAPAGILKIDHFLEQQKFRPWLAHGRFRFVGEAVDIELTSYPHNQRLNAEPMRFHPLEMLQLAQALEASLRSLKQQLGQIVASAKRRTAA
jgi:hypothetical protein